MDAAAAKPSRIAVIGGGISGLAAAFRLQELAPKTEIVLYEAGERLGGVLETQQQGDYLVEQSADNFITNVPWGLDLCRRLGIEGDLLQTNDALRKAYVVCRGKLIEVPEGFLLMAPGKAWPILRSPILSWGGKLRLAWEYFVPSRKETSDECLHDFVVRRLGSEAYDRLVQPLIGGIYTADPKKLSVAATMKQFVEMERKHGGLIRGMRKRIASEGKSDGGARYSMFVAPRGGMSAVVDAITARLPSESIRLNAPVRSIDRQEDGPWIVTTDHGAETFDGVVVAAPAPAASQIMQSFDAPLASEVAKIQYAGCAIVLLGVRKEQIARPIAGFGFVVPEVENRRILATSFASYKFPGRAPDDSVLIRTFVGGACHPEMNELPEEELRKIVTEELADLIGLSGEPQLFAVRRWSAQMPQYHVGHLELVERIEQLTAKHAGLALVGNAYHGVGVPLCIRTAEQAVERLVEQLALGQVER
ncbi:protoporphyrinogen oxidase [Blastopirellula sp. JC732]|uniref:Coproporphyrinogen III oxidase n=1 Tax=Blastopirellula sediminis TaxID=2894196 RepID=A0A9X1MKK0_9BACT|nr:protoporphyrinogen oxidase [Blastopirellula sediminis]MCC9609587.1 protoporphyrinogen oxidase [Blastopirellula sediminis]MCC9627637.1 protoporphyrinogen oxidase [Blastopirellula sediminis]